MPVKYFFIVLAILSASAVAYAQQPPVNATELALQINNAISNMALSLVQLQKQNQAAQTRIRELEAKCGDACKSIQSPVEPDHAQ